MIAALSITGDLSSLLRNVKALSVSRDTCMLDPYTSFCSVSLIRRIQTILMLYSDLGVNFVFFVFLITVFINLFFSSIFQVNIFLSYLFSPIYVFTSMHCFLFIIIPSLCPVYFLLYLPAFSEGQCFSLLNLLLHVL